MKHWWIIALLLWPAYLWSQSVQVSATLDTNHIRIGEPIRLTLQAAFDTSLQIEWPLFDQSVQSFPIIETFDREQRTEAPQHMMRGTYDITAFDTGFIVLAPIAFGFFHEGQTTTDTFLTEPLLVRVDFVNIDTTQPYKPIKGPIDAPMTWREWLPYAAIPLMLVILGLIIWYLYNKQKEKPRQMLAPIPVPKEPAHVVALRQLEALERAELWQAGDYKEYHDRVSAILRGYIEGRFHIEALENTTEELLVTFNKVPVPRLQVEQLREVLIIADLAKFAKVEPLPEENAKSLMLSRDFIQATKAEENKEEDV